VHPKERGSPFSTGKTSFSDPEDFFQKDPTELKKLLFPIELAA
jgi:hypothetical protein